MVSIEETAFDPSPHGLWIGEKPNLRHVHPSWSPIETAPRDGTWIMAYSPGLDRCLVMTFKESSGHFVDVHEPRRVNWAAPDMQPTLWAPWP